MNWIFKWSGIFFFIININSHESYLFFTCFIGPSKVTCPTDFWAGAGQADKCYCRAPAGWGSYNFYFPVSDVCRFIRILFR
jgi:hypothetical protein